MLFEIILEAWIALKRNYTRSLLTMLGIVWGIATVTLLIAYGSSFRKILVGGFDAFGKSVVICWPQQTSEQPGGQRAGQKVLLEQADIDMVKETAPLAGFAWRTHDGGGTSAIVKYEQATDHEASPAARGAAQEWILGYNEDDVRATASLRDWLDGPARELPSIEIAPG